MRAWQYFTRKILQPIPNYRQPGRDEPCRTRVNRDRENIKYIVLMHFKREGVLTWSTGKHRHGAPICATKFQG